MADVAGARDVSYSDIDDTVRRAIFGSGDTLEDWQEMKSLVKKDLETRIQHLGLVFDMLTYMGLTESQAETVLAILCSDNSIPDSTREDLVSLYKDYITLEPFTQEVNAIPIQGATDVFKTSQKEKVLRFLIAVQHCLPLTINASSLEMSLSEAVHHIHAEKVKSNIMQASGVMLNESLPATREPEIKKSRPVRSETRVTEPVTV